MAVREPEPLQWEHVPCVLCGTDNGRPLFSGRDRRFGVSGVFNIVECRCCGLIYINPRPTQTAIPSYYPATYRGFSRAVSECRIIRGFKERLKYLLFETVPQWWPILSRFGWAGAPWLVAVHRSVGRVLDVGCGEGRTLLRLKRLGWETYGVELDPEVVDYVASNAGLNIRCGQLEEVRFPANHFDLVVFHHSLEHLPYPLSSLREAHRVLKEDGEVLVEVPNVRSFQARLFKDKWIYWDVPRHLYAFSDVTLRWMLIEAGFSTVSLEPIPATGGFTASLQYVWNDLLNDPAGRRIWNSKFLRTGLWPVASVLARLGYAGCVRARAIKDSAVP